MLTQDLSQGCDGLCVVYAIRRLSLYLGLDGFRFGATLDVKDFPTLNPPL